MTDTTPGESVVITQLRRQLEDAESLARLTKQYYIRRCERLAKARDDRQALLDGAATLIEAGKDGGIESWGDQAIEWLRDYRAAAGVDDATTAAAQQREERAEAEARSHQHVECTCEHPPAIGQLHRPNCPAYSPVAAYAHREAMDRG